MRPGALLVATALLLGAGCTSDPPPPAPTPAPTPTPSVVTDPLATAEPDSAGIVVLRSRAVLDDGPGDVWRLTPRPARVALPAIDVRRTVIEVSQDGVRVTTRFVALRPVGRTTYDLGLRTPRGLFYLDAVSDAGSLVARSRRLVDPAGDGVRCPGLADRVDRASRTVTLDVPLRCLGHPPWVAARLLVSLQVGTRTYEENPHNHRPFSEFFTDRLYPRS